MKNTLKRGVNNANPIYSKYVKNCLFLNIVKTFYFQKIRKIKKHQKYKKSLKNHFQFPQFRVLNLSWEEDLKLLIFWKVFDVVGQINIQKCSKTYTDSYQIRLCESFFEDSLVDMTAG